jgi:hypothetical protein
MLTNHRAPFVFLAVTVVVTAVLCVWAFQRESRMRAECEARGGGWFGSAGICLAPEMVR